MSIVAFDRKKGLAAIGIAIAVFCFVSILYRADVLTKFEYKAYDLCVNLLGSKQKIDDIVIVKVDQGSIDALSKQQVNWPWPREIYATLVEYLSQADAVFVDILFTEPSFYGVGDDRIFAEAVKKAGNVVLPTFLSKDDRQMSVSELEFLDSISLPPGITSKRHFKSAVMQIYPLLSALSWSGNVTISPDSDGVYRRIPLIFDCKGKTIPHFVLGYLLKKGVVGFAEGRPAINGIPLPLYRGSLLLRYHKTDDPFDDISASAILNDYIAEQDGNKPKYDRSYFKGKKVFIGFTAAGLFDLKSTPVAAKSTGVYIHAVTLDNLLRRNFMTPLSPYVSFACMLFICLTAIYFVLTHLKFSSNLIFMAVSSAVISSGILLLFANGYYLQILPIIFGFVGSVTISAAYSYAVEGRERKFVRRTFGQYMDETIVAHVLEHPELIKPGGQRKRVTVFFADIAGFTTMAERLPPEETARILHTVLNAFSEVVIANKGVIDKYIGDCIMAFWGAPLATEGDESNACRAALECMSTLAEINNGFIGNGLSAIAIRIGIHSGDAIVGNLGSDRLFDYTVIGDTVNLASRLEGANKQFKTKIMVSEETLERTGDEFLARELGRIEVKGKSKPVRIFELTANRSTAKVEIINHVEDFSKAVALFKAQDFDEALIRFNEQLLDCPDDGPSSIYKARCENMRSGEISKESLLTDDWNVIKLTEK